MRKTFNQFLGRIAPFLGMGIFLVLLVAGIIIFSYLLIFGAAVGLILFAIFWIYNKLARPKPRSASNLKQPGQGRIIDHDEK